MRSPRRGSATRRQSVSPGFVRAALRHPLAIGSRFPPARTRNLAPRGMVARECNGADDQTRQSCYDQYFNQATFQRPGLHSTGSESSQCAVHSAPAALEQEAPVRNPGCVDRSAGCHERVSRFIGEFRIASGASRKGAVSRPENYDEPLIISTGVAISRFGTDICTRLLTKSGRATSVR